jgi:molybdenum cofactor biosynthesis enzyme MoaA
MLIDNHGRQINYLRLAVTDKCNLRCFYCMPSEGLNWIPKKKLFTYEEMLHLCTLLAKMGIEKVRITGGEPFIRKDIMQFLYSLSEINEIKPLQQTEC